MNSKGELIMTLVPFTDCCALLGIDAKTFRKWLQQANVPFSAHPKDARIKCLSMLQVQQVATLHGRPLPAPVSPAPLLDQALGQAQIAQESEVQLAPAPTLLPPCGWEETDLRKQLSCLEAKLSTVQEQLAQLALELLHERSQRYERRLSSLEALLPQTLDRSADPTVPHASVVAAQPEASSLLGRPLHPAELQARSRLIPLIEYGARGQYVVICPQLGELALIADSPEWFAWLATLPSFRFVGQQGRFTAYRRDRRSRSWRAHRSIHQHDYKQTLGVTDQLTIQRLEQAAATLQSHLDSL
jgi:hypothetical protein